MPLDRYQIEDPFENHPLFKSEEQARIEETLDGEPAVELSSATLPWPGEETARGRRSAETDRRSTARLSGAARATSTGASSLDRHAPTVPSCDGSPRARRDVAVR